MLMGAFGARGTLLAAAQSGGFELAAEADGLVLSVRSEAVPDLVAATAEVERAADAAGLLPRPAGARRNADPGAGSGRPLRRTPGWWWEAA